MVSISILLLSPLAFSQMRHSTAAPDLNEHVFAIVPLIGAGTTADPKRPMFVPAGGVQPALPPTARAAGVPTPCKGLLAYHAQLSDDGKFALVEFIGPAASDLNEVLSSPDSRVRVFRKGLAARADIEAAFRVYKKDFSFHTFQMMGGH